MTILDRKNKSIRRSHARFARLGCAAGRRLLRLSAKKETARRARRIKTHQARAMSWFAMAYVIEWNVDSVACPNGNNRPHYCPR